MSTSSPSVLSRVVLGIGILAIFIAVAVVKCGNTPTPIDLTTHDTIYRKQFIYDTVKAKIDVPTLVTQYITVPQHDTTLSVQIYHDTIKIMRHDTLMRDGGLTFLTTFIESPKLILGDFSTNSISLNLLTLDGSVVKKQWNVDYTKNSYEFYGTDLRTIPIPKKGNIIQQMLNPLTTSSYLYTYYLPFRNGATMKLDYTIAYKRLGVSVFGQLTTTATPLFEAGIGLRAQIK